MTRPLEVPPRTNQAGKLRCEYGRMKAGRWQILVMRRDVSGDDGSVESLDGFCMRATKDMMLNYGQHLPLYSCLIGDKVRLHD